MLVDLLKSIEAQSVRPSLVLVVDNNSAEEARQVVEAFSAEADLSVAYLPMGGNAGPAGAFSKALIHLHGVPDIEWMMCRGDDNPFPAPDAIAEMKEFAETVSHLAPVGIGNRGVRFEANRARAVSFRDEDLRKAPWLRTDALPGGGSPTYRIAEVLAAGANFDPFLFFGYEELDMGLQLKKAGLPLLVNSTVQKRMREQFGTKERPGWVPAPWRTYFHYRNLLIVGRRHGTIGGVALLLIKSLIKTMLAAATLRDLAHVKAQIMGTIDGALNRPARASYIPK